MRLGCRECARKLILTFSKYSFCIFKLFCVSVTLFDSLDIEFGLQTLNSLSALLGLFVLLSNQVGYFDQPRL